MSDRQDEIVGTALRLISECGIQELTMKKIAAAIGITEPALYRHFASKFQILSAVVDTIEAARSALSRPSTLGVRNAESDILAFFIGHARLFTREPAMTVILFSEDLFRNDKELSERVAAIMEDTRHRMQEALTVGVKTGMMRADLDLPMASLLLVGGFRQLVSSWRLASYRFSLEEHTVRLVGSTLRLFARA
jgi:AcrR family transcriptional regulator